MKIKICFILLMLGFILNINAQIPTNGLVGYWPFNGNANDESGNNNHGSVSEASLTFDRFGMDSSAYSFNGENSYIDVLHSSSLDFKYHFSISIWFIIGSKDYPSDPNMWLFTKCRTTSPDGFQWTIEYWPGVSNQLIFTEAKEITEVPYPWKSNIIDTTKWHNIIIVKDSINYSMYIDGVLDTTTTVSSIIDQTGNTNRIVFGAENDDAGIGHLHYFSGKLDDIRLYNRTLNSNEVNLIYNEGKCFETVYDTIPIYDTTFVTIYDSIAVTDTLIIDVTLTGIDPPDNVNSIKVYPNPIKDAIFIHTGNNFEQMIDYKIKIINTKGSIIFESNVTQQLFEIDVSDFGQTGLYFIQIINNSDQIIDIRKILLE